MSKELVFANKETFKEWLSEHGTDSDGVWLIFGKKGGPTTLSANDALEEALCFGWIDGQMQSLDDTKYKKYFARRIAKSHWSEKNKKLAEALILQGRMTQVGMNAIENAKKNGAWEKTGPNPIQEEQIEAFRQIIQPYEPAYTHLLAMSFSVQKTYTAYYLDAKTEKTRQTRLEKIIDRLNNNLKPM